MILKYHTVSEFLLDCLKKLMANPVFDDFVLVGGTALSLQLGHRMSIDIDLFTQKPYGSMNTEQIKSTLSEMFNYVAFLEGLNERSLFYPLYIGKNQKEYVKLDLAYTDEFITPIIEQDGLRLASLQDIAAMKMQAIVNSKRKKDFWDIHELLEHYSLKELIDCGLQRNPYTLSQEEILTALCNADKLTQNTEIHCLKGKFWELIIEDLKKEAQLIL